VHRVLWIILPLIAFQVPQAKAVTFDWSYSGTVTSGVGTGNAVSGSGTLDAVLNSGNQYIVDAIAGTANGLTVTGLTGYSGEDQLIYWPGAPNQLDFGGVAFLAGGEAFNFYYLFGSSGTSTPGTYDCGAVGYCLVGPGISGHAGDSDHDPLAQISFEASPVGATPLPSTWSMLLCGFFVIGFMAIRGTRKKRADAALAAA
jgi:hypothetical protein